ncbi:MAG: PspC domain-containing protein, partial [Anaerolineae bacterium]
ICGGWGEYLGIDPNLLRIAWLFLTFAWGSGLLIYLIMAIVIPENPEQEPAARPASRSWENVSRNSLIILGALLALIGVVLLVNSLGIFPFELRRMWVLFWRLFWPMVVIGLGIALLVGASWGGREWWKEFRLPQAGQPLYRSRSNRMIAGVCGGLGEYFHIDPTLIRLVWAIGTLSTMGSGILAYILAAVILPEEPVASGPSPEKGE